MHDAVQYQFFLLTPTSGEHYFLVPTTRNSSADNIKNVVSMQCSPSQVSHYPNCWISHNSPRTWSVMSPDLTPLDYYLWGHMKDMVY
jgi:hypothetical protein